MKNQQGAPEALLDPSPDQLRAIARTARNSSGSASDDCGPLAYVLHGWRAAVIAFRAQQPAAHVQKPSGIEHVASDVSKNGPKSNMAQQPAPSAAAAGLHADAHLRALLHYTHGFYGAAIQHGMKAGETANAIAHVESAARALHRLATQPSPTPQADSQPAPVRDERDDFEKVFPLPSGCIRVGTGYASTGYSNWAAHTHVERWQGWQARAARKQGGAT